jgi:hypothetical protein
MIVGLILIVGVLLLGFANFLACAAKCLISFIDWLWR